MLRTFHVVGLSGLLSLLLITSCAKNRPDRLSQGEEVGLDRKDVFGTDAIDLKNPIEGAKSYQGKIFRVRTGDAIGKRDSSKAEEFSVSESVTAINNFPLVILEKRPELLGDTPFRARPHTDYEIHYRLGPKYLKVYKVGARKDIPSQELDFGEVLADGRIAVPLVGYEIEGYYTLENRLNDSDEKTHEVRPIRQNDYRVATHVRFRKESKTDFEAIQKIDVYPKEIFDGEWYFTETVIDTANRTIGAGSSLGSSAHDKQMAASIIKFRNTGNRLQVAELDRDLRVRGGNNELALRTLVEIPIEQVAYRIKPSGSEGGLTEEIDNNIPDSAKPYLKIDFEKIVSGNMNQTETTIFDPSDKKVKKFKTTTPKDHIRLIDVELDADFIGLTFVKYGERAEFDNTRVKLSFLRKKPRNYTARAYPLYDQLNGIGFFAQEEPREETFEILTRPAVEKLTHLSRFNPKMGKVVFHFSTLTPKSSLVREVGRTSVKAWDRAFQLAGVPLRIELDESKDVGLGDPRYNVLNFIDHVGGAGHTLGYGPSYADPYTGEILTSTANVDVTSEREHIISSLRRYVQYQAGEVTIPPESNIKLFLAAEGSVPAPISLGSSLPSLASGEEGTDRFDSIFLKEMRTDLNKILNKTPDDAETTQNHKVDLETLRQEFQNNHRRNMIYGQNSTPCAFGSALGSKFSEVEQECKGILQANIDGLKSDNRDIEKENAAYLACANRLLPRYLAATVVHEMGHNFGLRHVFNASADKDNFWTQKELAELHLDQQNALAPYASIMDYGADTAQFLTIPGKTDIASIRYGYGDAIQLVDNSVAQLDTELDLEKNEKKNHYKRKPYKFCTDEHMGTGVDPLCQMWDYGTTPEEVVDTTVAKFWTDFNFVNRRRDNQKFNTSYQFSNFMGFTLPRLKRIYDEWRHILTDYNGGRDKYLTGLDEKSYTELLGKMSRDEKFKEKYKIYRPAAEKAFNFFLKLAQLNNHYCVFPDKDGKKYIELETLRTEIYFQRKVSVSSCKDEEIARHLGVASNQVGEVGYFINDVHYSMRPEENLEINDAAGTKALRIAAMYGLANRAMGNLLNVRRDLFPNFLDEPTFRGQTEKWLQMRILNGVEFDKATGNPFTDGFQKLVTEQKPPQEPTENTQPKFSFEADLIESMASLYRKGLRVDGEASSTLARLAPWATTLTPDKNLANSAKEFGAPLKHGAVFIIATGEENRITKNLLDKVKELDTIQETFESVRKGYYPPLVNVMKYFEQIGQMKGALERSPQIMVSQGGFGLMREVVMPIRHMLGAERAKDAEQFFKALLGEEAQRFIEKSEEVAKTSQADQRYVNEIKTVLANAMKHLANSDEETAHRKLAQMIPGDFVQKEMEKLKSEFESFAADQREYAAQRDLIVGVLKPQTGHQDQ